MSRVYGVSNENAPHRATAPIPQADRQAWSAIIAYPHTVPIPRSTLLYNSLISHPTEEVHPMINRNRFRSSKGAATNLQLWSVVTALLLFLVMPAAGQMEFQYQYGQLVNPFSERKSATHILTFQHAGGWKYGDTFFFIDMLDDRLVDGFNDLEFYGEWYPTLSISKIMGKTSPVWAITDLSLVMGTNFDGDANVFKYLPGARLSWNVPGFIFLNTMFTAVMDASYGVEFGSAPTTGNGFMFDVSWLYPFSIGFQQFAFTGHAEYISGVDDELGQELEAWILAQPQLVWDVGAAFGGSGGHLLAGIEYQYWRNKLGTKTQESALELLIVWRI